MKVRFGSVLDDNSTEQNECVVPIGTLMTDLASVFKANALGPKGINLLLYIRVVLILGELHGPGKQKVTKVFRPFVKMAVEL